MFNMGNDYIGDGSHINTNEKLEILKTLAWKHEGRLNKNESDIGKILRILKERGLLDE